MDKKDFILEEYKQLWSYYHKLLDERKNMLEWYFKVVGLPLGLIGYFLVQKEGQFTLPPEVGAVLLVVVFLVGISLYGAYAKESSNANKYLKAMIAIREYANKHIDGISGVVVIDTLRDVSSKSSKLGSTALWRIMPLVFINSAIALAATKLLGIINSIGPILLLYSGFIVLHYIFYKVLYTNHNK